MSQVHTCEGPSASSSGLTLAGWVAWRRRSRLWPAARVAADNGQALTQDERQAVLSLINTEAYADLSIGQIWARARPISTQARTMLTPAARSSVNVALIASSTTTSRPCSRRSAPRALAVFP